MPSARLKKPASKPNAPRCDACRHCVSDDKKPTEIFCRAHPPVAIMHNGALTAIYPPVRPEWNCAKFQRRTPK